MCHLSDAGLLQSLSGPGIGVNRVVEVAAAVIVQRGHLLITKRRPDVPQGSRWEFPGGKCRPGEGLKACLHRELKEELGIHVEVGSRLETVQHAYSDYAVRLHFYACRITRGEPKPIGCKAITWVRPKDLTRYAFPEADSAFIASLREILSRR